MIVIAIDPGKTTGYVVIDSENLNYNEHYEIDSWFRVCEKLDQDLYSLISSKEEVSVVIERFVINQGTAKKSVQDEPRDIIGAVKYLTTKYTNHGPKLQNAAEAKTFSTNEKLKKVGFWYVGGAGHANDAYRHALVFMVNNNLLDPRILLDLEEE